jgi:hypothetical protein
MKIRSLNQPLSEISLLKQTNAESDGLNSRMEKSNMAFGITADGMMALIVTFSIMPYHNVLSNDIEHK